LPSSKRRTRPLVLGNKGARTPPNVSGHRNLGAVYRRKVEELETSLKDADHRDEAMEFIRMLVDKVELTPREGSGLSSTATSSAFSSVRWTLKSPWSGCSQGLFSGGGCGDRI
jgi:hypothetical protein